MLRDTSDICAQSDAAVLEFGEAISDQLVLGNSPAMKPLREKIASVASSRVPVLILGEKGSGKERFVRLVHRLSFDGAGSFVKVNCATTSATTFEECVLRATGAVANGSPSAASVASACAGTLFLDEVADLDAATQMKLLQLLQDGNFCQKGSREDLKIGLRLICTTARNPEVEIENGKFQQDLFYRISVISLQLPPLRERGEDIPVLAQHFIENFNSKFGCEAEPLSQDLVKWMLDYAWPGNIRQLQNLMKRYVILGSEELETTELSSKQEANPVFARIPEIGQGESISLKRVTKDIVRSFEREIITKVLEAHHGNRAEAARALNISYRSLLYKVKSAQLANLAAQNGAEQS